LVYPTINGKLEEKTDVLEDGVIGFQSVQVGMCRKWMWEKESLREKSENFKENMKDLLKRIPSFEKNMKDSQQKTYIF